MPESSNTADELTFAQVQELALLTTKLFYGVIRPKNLVEDTPFLKGTSFEGKSLTEQDQFPLVAEFSRKLIQINPNCSTAIRYLASSIDYGAAFIPQDLVGTDTPQDLVGTEFEKYLDSMMALIAPTKVAIELYRKVIAINPKDTSAICNLSVLFLQSKVTIVAEDLLGTPLQGRDPESLSPTAVVIALSRKVMELYEIGSPDLPYKAAKQQLIYCFCMGHAELTEKDLEDTPFKGYSLDSLKSAENIKKMEEWLNQFIQQSNFVSISNADAMIKDQEKHYLEVTRPKLLDLREQMRDSARTSIVSADKGVFYQLIRACSVEEYAKHHFLEVDFIKQDYLTRVSKNLVVSRCYLAKNENPITQPMLLGSKWENAPLEAVDRCELKAEFCRKAMKMNSKNTTAMLLLAMSIMDGATIEEADFVIVGEKRQGAKLRDRATVAVGLCKKAALMDPYNKEAQRIFKDMSSNFNVPSQKQLESKPPEEKFELKSDKPAMRRRKK